MQLPAKKTIVMLVCLAILMPAISVAYGETIEEKESSTETITLFRYGPDGSITPVKVKIDTSDGKDLGEAIADKCEELFVKDSEMQNYAEKSISIGKYNISIGITKVKSHGRGFHFKTKFLEKLAINIILFKLELPRLGVMVKKPLVFCRYSRDGKAQTTMDPLLRNKENSTKIITGPHSVAAINFIGFTTWFGRVSISPILPRAFFGIANIVVCKNLS
jgi:hypothetical protein